MNKHCFRLIFSKTLGFLIPVAEIARAQRKPGQQPSVTPVILSPTEPFSWSLKRLVLSVLLAGLPGWAMADILVDPTTPAGSTNVVKANNGVPVIEIANPNAKGLSHNRFSEFDVQQPGVIFNNSRANGVSQIGGAVLLNPNLQRTATAILAEVTGNKPSSLAGTLEVFGDKADLLIAKVSKELENGAVLLGERHDQPDAALVTRQLIARGEVKHIIVERPYLSDTLKKGPVGEDLLKFAQEKGYPSIDNYINNSLVNGVRKDPEVLGRIIDYFELARTAEGAQNFTEDYIVDALKAGVKLHFFDIEINKGDLVQRTDFRNKYIAGLIRDNPELQAPGTIGVFGSSHIRSQFKEGNVFKSLQNLAGIADSRTFDLSAAFIDKENGKVHPRWDELNQDIYKKPHIRDAEINAYKAKQVEVSKGRLFKKKKINTVYKADKYERRIVVDTVGSEASREKARRLHADHPNNTLLFTAYGGVNSEYSAGIFGAASTAHLEEGSKVTVLRDEGKLGNAATIKLVDEIFNNKLEVPLVRKKLGSFHVPDDTNSTVVNSPDFLTNKSRPLKEEVPVMPLPLKAAQEDHIALSGKDGLIRQAEEQGLIDAERSDFLKLAGKEISGKLKRGAVLLGEWHDVPDSTLLIKQLIANKEVTNLLLERDSINELLTSWQGREAIRLANKKGYKSFEDYLMKAPVKDGVRKDPEILESMLVRYDFVNKDGVKNPTNDLISYALRAGVKLNYIDGRPKMADFLDKIDFRNRLMAWNINKLGLNAPGAIGSFGAEHLKVVEKNGKLLPTLQGLAGVDESQVYDLSPAFRDYETGKVHPRWNELGRRSNAERLPRKSEALPFNQLPSSDPLKPVYVRDKYGRRIVVDRLVNKESQAAADKIVDKYPSNTLVFKLPSAGSLEYARGFLNAGNLSSNNTKLYFLQDAGDSNGLVNTSGVLNQIKNKIRQKVVVKKIKKVKVPFSRGAVPPTPPVTLDDIDLDVRP